MKLPISACLIVKADEHLATALTSIAPYVEELCIACNGDDEQAATVSAALAHVACEYSCEHRFERFTDYNDADGRIADFAALRNRSFALATRPWAIWLDSDDVIVGADRLVELLAPDGQVARLAADPSKDVRVLFPYEFVHDHHGECVLLQWRERLVHNPKAFEWHYPVHEGCVSRDLGRMADVLCKNIVWKHQRANATDPDPTQRNLRIVRQWMEREPTEPRANFYLGLETMLTKEDDSAAIEAFERYLTMSKWPLERAAACIYLVELYWRRAYSVGSVVDLSMVMRAAEEAIKSAPTFDSYFALAKVAYASSVSATGPDERMRLLLAVDSLARGLASTASTPLAINPKDQSVSAYEILHDASYRLGRLNDALFAANKLAEASPEHGEYAFHARRHEHAIAKRAGNDLLDIAVLCPPAPEPWDPDIIAAGGMGGSETAVVNLARELAKRGHRVRVHGQPGRAGVYDKVEYRDLDELRVDPSKREACDVLVAWRNAAVVDVLPHKAAVAWAHDLDVGGWGPQSSLKVDAVLALTQFHRDTLAKRHGLSESRFQVTRNGIDLTRFEQTVERDPHKAIYSSSPDRGLGILLELWPRIRERVPDATLDIYYGFANWIKAVEHHRDFQHAYVIERVTRLIRETPGITYHGRKDQSELAKAMLGAGVWAYPTHWDETSCITAMEAQAAGMRIVTTARAALVETVGDRGTLIEGNTLSPDYQQAFVEAVVRAMTEPDAGDRMARQAYAREYFGWAELAEEWETMLHEIVANAEAGVLPSYSSVGFLH